MLYKNKFHILSIFKKQMGLISISGLLISNLSLVCFTIDHNVSMIECTSQKDAGNNDIFRCLNLVIYSLPSILNLQSFYDPIDAWMEEVCKSQSQPCHGLISHISSIFKQKVRMVLLFIHITSKPSLTCCNINRKERQIGILSRWLPWIYDFT